MIYRRRGGIGEFCSQPKMYFAAFKINIHVFVSLTSTTYAEMCHRIHNFPTECIIYRIIFSSKKFER